MPTEARRKRQPGRTSSAPEVDMRNTESELGPLWTKMFEMETAGDFDASHFEKAMLNVIHEPNINSTIILRSDILLHYLYRQESPDKPVVREEVVNALQDPSRLIESLQAKNGGNIDRKLAGELKKSGEEDKHKEDTRRATGNDTKDVENVENPRENIQVESDMGKKSTENGNSMKNSSALKNIAKEASEPASNCKDLPGTSGTSETSENSENSTSEPRCAGDHRNPETCKETSPETPKNGPSADSFAASAPASDCASDCATLKHLYLHDTTARHATLNGRLKLRPYHEIVRRIIPRNPYKDAIINQSCLVYSDDLSGSDPSRSLAVVYIPHIADASECPYYLPPVDAVAVVYSAGHVSTHYLPFRAAEEPDVLRALPATDRTVRIALRLLQTATKHSRGMKSGYVKRVHHDRVLPRPRFQDRYVQLKQKYGKYLVDNWVESTDPRKHVFEDIGIAAFLIELWRSRGMEPDTFEFRDLGCGNGLLVYLLIMEGYRGKGIDARARKSWKIYPQEVQSCLKEQIVIPKVLLKDGAKFFPVRAETDLQWLGSGARPAARAVGSWELLSHPRVNTADFPPGTFLIGNHSDELTLWIPLLGYPFVIIPCCSYNLSGRKTRFTSQKYCQDGNEPPGSDEPKSREAQQDSLGKQRSTYAALIEHTTDVARAVGWQVREEMLRIPSTRNAAILGLRMADAMSRPAMTVPQVIREEGGADGFVEAGIMLMAAAPRGH